MDFQQWRDQQQQPDQQQQQQQSPASALALFATGSNSNKTTSITSSLSAFPDSTPTIFPRMGSFFSLAQWQELELQALVYKYMLAGASVPLELILPIKRSLLGIPPYQYHYPQQYQHFQPASYWGRCLVDPEPGRCRRTDGKKWRCSREVVTGQKYCERHVHRGRNRSRKPVEIPTSTPNSGLKTTILSPITTSKETPYTLSRSSPTLGMSPLNQRPPDDKTVNGGLQQSYSYFSHGKFQDDKSDSRVLRKFFDDWPRSQQEQNNIISNASPVTSTTHLSISIPGNSSSDFCLKLSTGNSEKSVLDSNKAIQDEQPQPPANWSGWGHHGEASMGGPLAEALRSSASTPSPTSVLQKANVSMSETSSLST